MSRKTLRYAVIVVVLLLVAIQFVQPDRSNPPEIPAATFEAVAQPSPEVAAIVRRACRNCHSNSTEWPWYSWVAPVSWLIAGDVEDGRAHLNFSAWNLLSPEMSRLRLLEACQEVRAGEMPLPIYTLMHPRAKLTPEEIEALCAAAQPR